VASEIRYNTILIFTAQLEMNLMVH